MKRLIVGSFALILTVTTPAVSNRAQEPKIPSRPATPATGPLTPTKPIGKTESIQSEPEPAGSSAVAYPWARPEVIFAKHVIGLVKEKTKDRKVLDEANKLLDEDSLTEIEKQLTERPGDELHQAERFDKRLKEFDKKFAKVKEEDLREWVNTGGSNSTTKNVPWPLCIIGGCR